MPLPSTIDNPSAAHVYRAGQKALLFLYQILYPVGNEEGCSHGQSTGQAVFTGAEACPLYRRGAEQRIQRPG